MKKDRLAELMSAMTKGLTPSDEVLLDVQERHERVLSAADTAQAAMIEALRSEPEEVTDRVLAFLIGFHMCLLDKEVARRHKKGLLETWTRLGFANAGAVGFATSQGSFKPPKKV